MDQHIIDEYTAQHALWRKGGRLNIGRRSSRRDEREYLDRLLVHIPFVTFTDGHGIYKVLALPGRVEAITKKLRAANKLTSGAQYFSKLYRDQTRTHATPSEKARIMGELIASGDYQEYATAWDAQVAA